MGRGSYSEKNKKKCNKQIVDVLKNGGKTKLPIDQQIEEFAQIIVDCLFADELQNKTTLRT
jgi:hypothetical protein